ncbi:hypothetical protein KSP39_PZI012725 [Platanthera zijinensis]|uniref:Uncharacterized protein n=1 Tax=Platanthera zijinensis TaxID=2320716 RepID=A0AAP0BFR1_9ASPA
MRKTLIFRPTKKNFQCLRILQNGGEKRECRAPCCCAASRTFPVQFPKAFPEPVSVTVVAGLFPTFCLPNPCGRLLLQRMKALTVLSPLNAFADSNVDSAEDGVEFVVYPMDTRRFVEYVMILDDSSYMPWILDDSSRQGLSDRSSKKVKIYPLTFKAVPPFSVAVANLDPGKCRRRLSFNRSSSLWRR